MKHEGTKAQRRKARDQAVLVRALRLCAFVPSCFTQYLGSPKNILTFMSSPRSAAAVILVKETPQLEVFWMRRAPHMMFQGGFYAFPGGQLDPNEDAKICAARELLEEAGVRLDPATLIDVGRWVTPAFAPRRFDTCFFLAKCPFGQEPQIGILLAGWV